MITLSSFAIMFPTIDPVLINIGNLPIRWYSLAYIAGLLLGIKYIKYLDKNQTLLTHKQVDDLMVWVVVGIVFGGRLGYVFLYHPEHYLSNPGAIIQTWKGGMSFHGGVVGVIAAIAIFVKRHRLKFLSVTDMAACATPIGIFFGRIANFINGELYGRSTQMPWGVIFPQGGNFARHPSQIYESLTEGLLLFIIMVIAARKISLQDRPGLLSGIFLSGYGVCRILMECFREPDIDIGFILPLVTMGQILSIPMIILGIFLIKRCRK